MSIVQNNRTELHMKLNVIVDQGEISVNTIRVGLLHLDPDNTSTCHKWKVTTKPGLEEYEPQSFEDRREALDHFVSSYYLAKPEEYSVDLGSEDLLVLKDNGVVKKSEKQLVLDEQKKEDNDAIVEDALFLLDHSSEWPGNIPGRLRGNPTPQKVARLLTEAGYPEKAKIILKEGEDIV
jgi:hypothetical protein